MPEWQLAEESCVSDRALSADEVIGEVERFYAGQDRMSGTFYERITNASGVVTGEYKGRFGVTRPARMRWDYYARRRGAFGTKELRVVRSVISDGSQLLIIDQDSLRIIVGDQDSHPSSVAVAFLSDDQSLSLDFNAAFDVAGELPSMDDYVILLSPKEATEQAWSALYLVVHPCSFRVKRSLVVDASGARYQFNLFDPDFERALEDSVFQFDVGSASARHYKVDVLPEE